MNASDSNDAKSRAASGRVPRWLWPVAAGGLFLVLVALLLPRTKGPSSDRGAATNAAGLAKDRRAETVRPDPGHRHFGPDRSSTARTPEQLVAEKVVQFGRKRRELVHIIARRKNLEVPPEIEAFFDAIEAGNWDDIRTRWRSLANRSGQYEYGTHAPDLDPFWPSVLDAYGVAEQAHQWPAQKLLDYGNSILDSLQPGMVYVGGTDEGRWVPELLNETSGGEEHVIVTQNALADGRYLEFLTDLYGERFAALTTDDLQRGFQEYLADAQKRFDHDQQFPDEPKQLRPGEALKVVDGKVQVSGQVAVMGVNEKLLEMLMQKNPELSFAMQESFSMPGLYGDAAPLGPLMELGTTGAENTFTADRATQAVDYWRTMAQSILADPAATASDYALRSYSHNANSAANLLAARQYYSEAEQAYRLSSQLWPGNPDAAGGLATILARTGRADQARQVLDDFARNYPDQRSAIEKVGATITWPPPSPAN
jgi:tetratricopeptide (TPR) repeat protein